MFKHKDKEGEDKEVKDKKDKKEDKKKEKERHKTEKKQDKDEKKRTISGGKKDALPERSLSSPTFGDSPPNSNRPSSPALSPRQASRATVNVEQLSLEKDALDTQQPKRNSLESSGPPTLHRPVPVQAGSNLTVSVSSPATPTPNPLNVSSNSLAAKSVENNTKRSSDGKVAVAVAHDGKAALGSAASVEQVSLLKTKISTLPPDTKQLVEYLLNIFSRALPDKWTPPANMESLALDDQVDVTLDKLVEASEILFNKDAPSLLKRYGKDLRESANRRTDKWKSIANLLSSDDSQFLSLFLSSDALDSIVISALLRPLESDESEILSDLLRLAVIRDISLKELLSVVQAASKSNAHVKQKLNDNKSLTDAIVELVCSFKKLSKSVEEEFQVQDLKKDASDVSESLTQTVSLLEHANIIKHAKSGNDIIQPLESYFQERIVDEQKEGERWASSSEEAKAEKAAKLLEIDEFIADEERKLKNVQANITDLESKLEQKKAEEKHLQETLAQKLKEREQYVALREKVEAEIKAHIEETAQHLEHHKKAEESVTKFSQDVTSILDKEVSETLKKTKDVLFELDKEVSFLEEKMVTYERSMSLFNNADEPEVLDGLKKLFTRSTAIYSESKQSVARVTNVVDLMRTVLGDDSTSVEELAHSLDKISARQQTLNVKYKLQKE